jgi:hypothetical protein
MKRVTLLAFLLTSGATICFAQDDTSMTLTQCRDLAEAGNFVGSDEVLVNGRVCKVQKTTPAKMQSEASENHSASPTASAVQSTSVQNRTQTAFPVTTSSDLADGGKGSPQKMMQPTADSSAATPPTTPQKPSVASKSPAATITFVTIQNGNVVHLMPDWAIKWVRKNEKKYPGVRFQTSGEPVAGAKNFVVAFSASSAEVQGFQPVTHTDTSMSTNPVSGNGTVTNNQGEMWNYTYNGTVTTTTTTTTHEQAPYTRSSNTLYVTAFNEEGGMAAQRWHVYSTQSGGNAANGLGYNLGNALAAINARGHMLKTIVDDVVGKGK